MKMMNLKYNVEVQRVLDKIIAVLPPVNPGDDTRILNLNETSLDILNAIKDGLTEDDICKHIAEIYDIDEEIAKEDTKAFIQDLKNNGIVE